MPVRQSSQASQRKPCITITMTDATCLNPKFCHWNMQLLSGKKQQLALYIHCSSIDRARTGGSKAARIASRSDRPGTGSCIHLRNHTDAARLRVQYLRHDLLDDGLMSLAFRCTINAHRYATKRIYCYSSRRSTA